MVRYRDLAVWQKSMTLAERVYRASNAFPPGERFGLTSQVRRATVSIASNIAEGKAVGGQSYRRHLKIALGSEAELQTQLELATRLGMLNQKDADDIQGALSEVGRMLVKLLSSLPQD